MKTSQVAGRSWACAGSRHRDRGDTVDSTPTVAVLHPSATLKPAAHYCPAAGRPVTRPSDRRPPGTAIRRAERRWRIPVACPDHLRPGRRRSACYPRRRRPEPALLRPRHPPERRVHPPRPRTAPEQQQQHHGADNRGNPGTQVEENVRIAPTTISKMPTPTPIPVVCSPGVLPNHIRRATSDGTSPATPRPMISRIRRRWGNWHAGWFGIHRGQGIPPRGGGPQCPLLESLS
jgi:hypothetical protein